MPASPTRFSPLIPILVRLYPPDWRARYGAELGSVLADTALTPSAVLDIALGALDARMSRDYPSEAGAGRKVRRPMLDRLAPVAIVLGGVFMATFIVLFLAVGSPEGPDSGGLLPLFYIVPFAVGVLAVGIGGIALGRLGRDPVARGLGLLASASGLVLAVAILLLFVVGDIAWASLSIVMPAFALASGLLGLRMLATGTDARLQGGLLLAGLVAAGAWTVGWYLGEASASGSSAQAMAGLIQTLGFGITFVGWLAVGLLGLRGNTPSATGPVAAT